MIVSEIVGKGYSHRIAFKKQGSHVGRKYRCTSGPRKGQVRASPAACNAPINIKKAHQLRQTKAKQGTISKVRRSLTKTYNPTSKIVRQMNKPLTPKKRKKVR